MNQRQINKSRMYQAMSMVLDKRSDVYASNEPLVAGVAQLKNRQASIDEARQVQELATTGLTEQKSMLRIQLNAIVLRTSSALVAYYTSSGNLDLRRKAMYSKTAVQKASDQVICDIGKLLFSMAGTELPNLSMQSYEQAQLDELQTATDALKGAIPQNRVATVSKKNSTGKLALLYSEIDALLKDKLDVYMEAYQYTHPDFYAEYKNARIIVDYTGRGKTNGDEGTTEGPVEP